MPATQPDLAVHGQDGRNTEGRATAITVVTPLRPFATPLLHAVFWLAGHVPGAKRKLEKLSFIHYARWSVLSAVADNGPPQRPVRLRNRYLFFESNFNGTWDEYIDAFSEVVPWRMRAIWGTSYGFPGPRPVGPFKDYIRANDLPVLHYYSAYPEATTTQVRAALRVRDRLEPLRAAAPGLSPERFQARWQAFLTDVQHDL